MNKPWQILIFFSVVLLSSSCLKQTESITPLAEVRTIAQLQRESMMNTALMAAGNEELSSDAKVSLTTDAKDPTIFYLNLKYNIVNMDVFETAHIPNSFEKLGNSLLKMFAKIFIKLSGSRTINIGNIELIVPDLNLDFDIVKSIRVKSVIVEYNSKKGNFSFINTLNLSKISGSNPLMLSYNKAQNMCQQKCLNFEIVNGDILDLIKDKQSVKLKPFLNINSLPAISELKLDGQIELQIGLKLPF